jgi:hypothetical protein
VAERQLPKLNVAGSIPVSRSIFFTTSNKTSGHKKSTRETCIAGALYLAARN